MKWNDDWRDELKYLNKDCYIRLCECRNIGEDIIPICNLMKWYNLNKSCKKVLDRVIDWLTDWNGQTELIPTPEEYVELL